MEWTEWHFEKMPFPKTILFRSDKKSIDIIYIIGIFNQCLVALTK